MTDIDPDKTDTLIVVSPSPASDQASTGARDALLLVAALPALIAVLGSRDVTQIVGWFAGQQGLAFLGLAIAIGTPIWRQWIARRKHADLKSLAADAPDSKAVVK